MLVTATVFNCTVTNEGLSSIIKVCGRIKVKRRHCDSEMEQHDVLESAARCNDKCVWIGRKPNPFNITYTLYLNAIWRSKFVSSKYVHVCNYFRSWIIADGRFVWDTDECSGRNAFHNMICSWVNISTSPWSDNAYITRLHIITHVIT